MGKCLFSKVYYLRTFVRAEVPYVRAYSLEKYLCKLRRSRITAIVVSSLFLKDDASPSRDGLTTVSSSVRVRAERGVKNQFLIATYRFLDVSLQELTEANLVYTFRMQNGVDELLTSEIITRAHELRHVT